MAQPPGHAPRLTGTRQATSPPQYHILGRIASGGMGSVYLGMPEKGAPSSLVAIKIIHEHLAENRMFVHMLLDEANLARRLSHPNVVSIIDVGDYEGRQFVVMPYIEGGTLSELARKHEGKLPIGLVVRVMIDALNGLHAAHAMVDDEGKPLRIVHRDMSPGNILVGTDGAARVIDFGVAKAASRMTQTAPGIVKGKFSYMAPEQALGEKIDHRADVFSAGVVLWTMLTGKRLFTGDNSAHTIRNLMSAEVAPPSHVRPQVPKCFDEVCFRALERNRQTRFQSAAEMAEALYTAAIIAETLASPAEVGRQVQESFAARIACRREAIEQQRSAHPKSFQLDVADLDRDPFEQGTPITPSAHMRRSSSSLKHALMPDLLDGSTAGSARDSAGAVAAYGRARPRAAGRPQGRRSPAWTAVIAALLLAATVAAIAGMGDRVPVWTRVWEALGPWRSTAQDPAELPPVQPAPAADQDQADPANQGPAAQAADAPPDPTPALPPAAPPAQEPVIIDEPVIIPIPGGVTAARDGERDQARAEEAPGASRPQDRSKRAKRRARQPRKRDRKDPGAERRDRGSQRRGNDARGTERERNPPLAP